ncbi:N-acetyl-alpha-D-glucosaminyl L-malate synthase BshA [Candidatus Bathyarchaeota archaeon]|nr:N-acetyl-alpha-D-glucosaminyl L-malate synthase BshA [Candidatus Bathyarchaeota archaeon]MBS7631037.1 N-acetyl-alpha-D-glucosaminyl L-malate synthase BshA [Candidatus Bathyarchaeota archaeon]
MRIGISCYPTIGGSGILATRLGIELAKKGNEIHFITYEPPIEVHKIKHENIILHHVSVIEYPLFKYPPYTIALASKMVQVAQRCRLDLIHVHYAIPHATSALLTKLVTNTPYIVTLHGSDVTIIGSDQAYCSINSYSIENADGVTAVSKYLANEAREKLGIKKGITVVPNFVDTEVYSPEIEADKQEQFLIVHVSNFRPVKRVQDIVEAISLTTEVDKDIRLLLVGDGPEKDKIEAIVKKKNLSNQVHFTGFRRDIPLLLKQCDAFVLSSDSESAPLTLLEAMSTGLPVIATNVGGVPEIIENRKNGILVSPRSPKSIAENILELKHDEEFRKHLSLEARKTILEKYTPQKVIEKYEEVYKQI